MLGLSVNDVEYDFNEIKNCISFEYIETVLGYGDIYRYVKFGNMFLNDGTFVDILQELCQKNPNDIQEILDNYQ